MTTERKRTIIIIAGTLVLGIFIGVLGSAMFARQHYGQGSKGPRGQREMGGKSRGDFNQKVFHIVAADSAQRLAMKPILDEVTNKIENIQGRSREQVQQVIDSMEMKLKPILREEQISKLKDFSKKIEKSEKGRRSVGRGRH